MSSKINAPVSGALQVNGVDVATFDATGVNSASNAGLATVTNSATPSIWTAAGFTIDLDNTGAVTTTGLVTGMTSAQIGSSKRIIVRTGQTWTVTASANLTIDGNTSGNNTFPAGSILEVIATSLTTVAFRTLHASGTWAPNQGSGLTVVGAFSSSGTYTKVGRSVTLNGQVNGATSIAVSAAGIISSNLPFTPAGFFFGVAVNGISTIQSGVQTNTTLNIYSTLAVSASSTQILFSITFLV